MVTRSADPTMAVGLSYSMRDNGLNSDYLNELTLIAMLLDPSSGEFYRNRKSLEPIPMYEAVYAAQNQFIDEHNQALTTLNDYVGRMNDIISGKEGDIDWDQLGYLYQKTTELLKPDIAS